MMSKCLLASYLVCSFTWGVVIGVTWKSAHSAHSAHTGTTANCAQCAHSADPYHAEPTLNTGTNAINLDNIGPVRGCVCECEQ